ncbi:hypothetical protein [Actinomyces sp. oral taxon 170]|uniref:hypothetical protein n=1 Tax=Actinomyces sp. oral taxon 170 TaxID=712117 RepID=UPI0002DD9BBD|nr:hypothetical protein [Actinomyces sp. oral taxon 170]
MFLLYSTKRFVPAKYLFPSTSFLIVFLIIPIVLTIQTSFTHFGDGYRGAKEEAITVITNNSMVHTEDSPTYGLSVATDGDVSQGPFPLFLVNPKTNEFCGEAMERRRGGRRLHRHRRGRGGEGQRLHAPVPQADQRRLRGHHLHVGSLLR